MAAGDVAVIVGTHQQANLVRDSLGDAGIPAVVSGNVSVFHTKAGDDWLVLLEALEQSHRSGRVRAAALRNTLSFCPSSSFSSVLLGGPRPRSRRHRMDGKAIRSGSAGRDDPQSCPIAPEIS